MSKIALTPDAAGTGIFTIASPNSNTDRTLSLPDETGTVLTSGTPVLAQKGVPAFSAYPSSAQSITSNVFTKILFATTEFDTTGGMYSSSRFTPTIAGYYQIQVAVSPLTTTTATQSAIYKNGALHKRVFSTVSNVPLAISALVYLDGSTDYVEGWGLLLGTTPQVTNASDQTYFQAVLVRAA